MDDWLNSLSVKLSEIEADYHRVLDELRPLEQKRVSLEEKLKTLKHLILLEKGAIRDNILPDTPAISSTYEQVTGVLVGKSARESYIELVNNHFKDNSFREKDIRELAIKEGLRVHGKPLASSYSRSLLVNLIKNSILEQVERGLYKKKTKARELLDSLGESEENVEAQ